jgi:hypothetical protein
MIRSGASYVGRRGRNYFPSHVYPKVCNFWVARNQTTFTSGLGQRLDAAVIDVGAAIENDFLDARLEARSAISLPMQPRPRCRRRS